MILLVLLEVVEYGAKLSVQANEVQAILFFYLGSWWRFFLFASKQHTPPNHMLQTLPYLMVMFQLAQSCRKVQERCWVQIKVVLTFHHESQQFKSLSRILLPYHNISTTPHWHGCIHAPQMGESLVVLCVCEKRRSKVDGVVVTFELTSAQHNNTSHSADPPEQVQK